MRKAAAIFLAISSSALLFFSSPTHAQNEQRLPADLLYVSGSTPQDRILIPQLIRLDAETLQPSDFYQDDLALSLYPLSWSPTGERLAVLRIPLRGNADRIDICMLRRDGTLETCFEDAFSRRLIDFLVIGTDFYDFAWSDDGQLIYFARDQACALELVEAEAATGRIQSILYRQEGIACDNNTGSFFITPSRQYLAVYTGEDRLTYDYIFTVFARSVTVVDLATSDTRDMMAMMPGDTGQFSFCPGISPGGHFLAARFYTGPERPADIPLPYRPGLALVDMEGHIVQTLDAGRVQDAGLDFMGCPSWEQAETGVYFIGGTYNEDWSDAASVSLYHYRLADGELAEVKLLERYSRGDSGRRYPMEIWVPSPGGTHLAFNYDAGHGNSSEVGVFFPDGTIMRFPRSAPASTLPVWFPPKSE
jgi:hypothetical protein